MKIIMCGKGGSGKSTLDEKTASMASEAGLAHYLILNKITPEMEKTLSKHVDMTRVIGKVDYQEIIFSAGLEGTALGVELIDDAAITGIVKDFKKNKQSG